HVQALPAEKGHRAAEAPLGLRMLGGRRVALRADDQERGRSLRGARADRVQQRIADDGLVRDNEDVRLGAGLLLEVDHDVLDRQPLCGAADPLDDVATQPTGALARVGRDDDLVRARLELHERVAPGGDRVRVDDVARGLDALRAKRLERPVEPAARGGATRVLVDDVALARLVDRADHRDEQLSLRAAPLERLDQALSGDGLVRDHEDVLHLVGTSSSSTWRSPLKTAWRASGTPYSYGLPTTCGISSKLKIGGGELTCHSSVSDRHGFAAAAGPNRQLLTML